MNSTKSPPAIEVLYDAAMVGGVSGAFDHVVSLADQLRAAGVDITALVSERELGESLRTRGVSAVVLPSLRRLPYTVRALGLDAMRLVVIVGWLLKHPRGRLLSRLSPLNTGLVAVGMSTRRAVVEVNGPLVGEGSSSQWSSLVVSALARSERAQLRAAQVAICVTDGLAHRAGVLGATRVVCIPNGADEPEPERPDERKVARTTIGVDSDAVVLLYAGSTAPWYDLETMAEAIIVARQDESTPWSLLLVGTNNGLSAATTSRLEASGIQVIENSWLSGTALRSVMLAANVGLVPLAPKTSADEPVGSPLKLFTYLSYGLPVVAPRLDGVNEVDSAFLSKYDFGSIESQSHAIRAAVTTGRRPVGTEPEEWSWRSRAKAVLPVLRDL